MSEILLKGRINLERAVVLLLDDSPESMTVLAQIISGFGIKTVHRCRHAAAAQQIAEGFDLDLVLANANTQNSDCYDFVRWLRHSNLHPNAFAPVMLVSGHTSMSNILKARDCGANYIVAKPLSPAVLLERIIWVAKEKRNFISCDAYCGPDRRVHEGEPPAGIPERRADRLAAITDIDPLTRLSVEGGDPAPAAAASA
jgi:DNA-binding response OmpR family regulator